MQACFPGGFYCVQLGSAYTRMDPEMRHVQSLLPPSSGAQAQRTVQGAPPRWHGWIRLTAGEGISLNTRIQESVSICLPRFVFYNQKKLRCLRSHRERGAARSHEPALLQDQTRACGLGLPSIKTTALQVQGPIRPAGGARQAPWPAPQAPSNHLTAELLPPLPRAPAGGEASRCSDWTNSR